MVGLITRTESAFLQRVSFVVNKEKKHVEGVIYYVQKMQEVFNC